MSIAFIGAGPSTIFAVLELLKNNYADNIHIIEKGKSLKERAEDEVISGWAGAGCFSDSKLSSALNVGGDIPGLTQEQLNNFNTLLLNTFNKFGNFPTPFVWEKTEDYDTKDSSLSWDIHKTCHIGTENGRKIYSNIEKYIMSHPNVFVHFSSKVEDISIYDPQPNNPYYKDNCYSLKVIDNSDENNPNKEENYLVTKVILATGQKDDLPSKVINKFKLKSTNRAFQLGVRVEDHLNNGYKRLIKANYDFKLVKDYPNDNIRIRTFCCNSGNAHTCAEKVNINIKGKDESFTCFNGHAFRTPDETNDTVNYGIMCEITGLEKYNSKWEQIELMHKINDSKYWKEDNFPTPKNHLLKGFKHLKELYPACVINDLEDFITCLSKLVNLKEATYLYPEVKLSGEIPELNYNNFSTTMPGLYMIGDCACTRGIVKASYTGYKLARGMIDE